MDNKNVKLDSIELSSNEIQVQPFEKQKFSWEHLWNSKLTIFRISLKFIYKNIALMVLTPIFIALMIIWQTAWSQTLIYNEFDEIGGIWGIAAYAIIGMAYILIYNLIVMIKFYGEEKQNGIYELEIRKGKSRSSIFFQRLAANKLVSFTLISFFILLYYVISSFTVDETQKHLMADLYTPGLSWLFVFDTLITLVILFLSFINKIKLTAALTTMLGIILMFFPMFSMLGTILVRDDAPYIDPNAEIRLNYAQKISQLREKYPNGVIDKMIKGNGTTQTSFANLGLDEWTTNDQNEDDQSKLALGLGDSFNFNSQLLFNGLIPDAQKLLSEIGVLEQIKSPNETNKYIYQKSMYTATSNLDELTKAQNTYFNQFFVNQKDLFFKENEARASVDEWKNTVFNIDLNITKRTNSYEDWNEETGRVETVQSDFYLSDYKQKTNNKMQAMDYLRNAIDDVTKNLVNDESNEWNELAPIIIDAFNETYLKEEIKSGDRYPINKTYLSNKNIFNGNLGSRSFGVGGIITDTVSFSIWEKAEGIERLFYPVLTTSVDKESMEYASINPELQKLQEQIFKTMTVKPGTRELISVMAGLVANSIILPTVIINDYQEDDHEWNGFGFGNRQDYTVEDVKHEQQKLYMTNPFTWIESILTRSAANTSKQDQALIKQNSSSNINSPNGINLTNYFVKVKENNKLKNERWFLGLELPSDEELVTPNYDWKKIEVVKADFSPIGALMGMLIINVSLIAVSYWIFKITLVK